MITKQRLQQFISWYQSVEGCVSHHELDWFVKSVEEYLQPTNDADIYALVLEAREEAEKWRQNACHGDKIMIVQDPLPWEEIVNDTNAPALCEKCGKNPATEPHTCPYAEDINDDHTTLCTCCEDCINNCCDDI